MREPILYKKLEDQYVQCQACLRKCIIAPIKTGVCGNRKNIGGDLEERFPNIIVIDTDGKLGDKPILYLPDSKKGNIVECCTPVLSVGGYHCNLYCLECPNPNISRPDKEDVQKAEYFSSDLVIKKAKEEGIKYIALTYNEFIPFPETTMEITKKAKEEGIEVIFVTNTTFTKKFIELFYESGGRIARLDLKASIESGNRFYKEYCGLEIKENGKIITINKILESIKHAKDIGLHIEIVSAITPFGYVPSNFPSMEEFEETAQWIKENLGEDTPWHLTVLRPKEKSINLELNRKRVKHYAERAKVIGLKNVDVQEKMCDCMEGELFGEKSCLKNES